MSDQEGRSLPPSQPPEQPEPPSAEQPTTAWTPPPPAVPPQPPTPPPTGGPVPPYSSGSGPLISATPAPTAGWTPPVAEQHEVAPGLVFSSTAARFVAYWIDAILLGLVNGAISASIGSGTTLTQGGQLNWTTADFVASVIGVAINGAYFVAFWSGGRRATLGQMLLKIQVGNAFDGKPLTFEQAIRRWLGLGQFLGLFAVSAGALGLVAVLSAVWELILLITTATSPTKQGLHDRFANSAVVRPANAGNGLVYACLFVLIVLPILAILAIISLVTVGSQVSRILSNVGASV
jgi:uncharacterized RDD family membrane protein YckC